MKRFAWLALFAFCTALAQVQPVDMPVTKHAVCDCCADQPNACGMPDCLPLPATSQPIVAQAVVGQRAEARRLTLAPRQKRESFYVQFVSRPALAPAFRAPSVAAVSASVSLFKAHCSFLI